MDNPVSRASGRRRDWARRVAMWIVLATVTAIMTVLFSYLGTLCLAVLAAMMAGSLRQSFWGAFGVSFVFPVVMVGMLQVWRVDVDLARQFMMGGLSFAMFWGVYFLTRLMISLEARPALSVPVTKAAVGSFETEGTVASAAAFERELGTPKHGQEELHHVDQSLRAFAGEWCCEMVHPGGRRVQKTLQVVGERFHLNIPSLDGEVSVVLDGWLHLGGDACDNTVTVLLTNTETTEGHRRPANREQVVKGASG